jgi:hypothetical protein
MFSTGRFGGNSLATSKFGWRDLLRISLWAVSAASAMIVAVYAGSSGTGRDRLRQVFAEVHETLIPSGAQAVQPLDAREGRRLADTVRILVADRERLVARIATLEQNVESVTGSIAKVEKSIQAPTPAPEISPRVVQTPEETTSSISPPASVPSPPSAPSPNVTKTEFGVDLGSATSVEALRAAWTAALRRHAKLLVGLRPVVQMRERPHPAGTEFRLVAGPIANAASAARICATLTAAAAVCAPAVFDGQRLAAR